MKFISANEKRVFYIPLKHEVFALINVFFQSIFEFLSRDVVNVASGSAVVIFRLQFLYQGQNFPKKRNANLINP